MPKDDLHFRLRIPDDLKAKVQSAATGNHRSMTAEIIARLYASFSDVQDTTTIQLSEISEKLDRLLEKYR